MPFPCRRGRHRRSRRRSTQSSPSQQVPLVAVVDVVAVVRRCAAGKCQRQGQPARAASNTVIVTVSVAGYGIASRSPRSACSLGRTRTVPSTTVPVGSSSGTIGIAGSLAVADPGKRSRRTASAFSRKIERRYEQEEQLGEREQETIAKPSARTIVAAESKVIAKAKLVAVASKVAPKVASRIVPSEIVASEIVASGSAAAAAVIAAVAVVVVVEERGGGGGGGGGGDSPPRCTRCRTERDSPQTQVETRASGRRAVPVERRGSIRLRSIRVDPLRLASSPGTEDRPRCCPRTSC